MPRDANQFDVEPLALFRKPRMLDIGRLRRDSKVVIGPVGELPIMRLHCTEVESERIGEQFTFRLPNSEFRKLHDIEESGHPAHCMCSMEIDGVFDGDVVIAQKDPLR